MRALYLLVSFVLALLLAACEPEAERSAHDLYLYGDEAVRLTYFYGGAGQIAYEGSTLELEDAPAADDRREGQYSAPRSLLVNGQPYLSAPLEPLDVAPATVSRIPLTTDMQLTINADVGEVVYYDGGSYLSLVLDGAPGVTQRVVPRPRLNELRGLGQLTNDEADAVSAALKEGGPFVLVELLEEELPPRPIDGLAEHRRTGLYVQHEISTDEGAFRPSPEQLAWETVASGNQATGVQSSRFELITNQQQLTSFWTRVHATQLQTPPLPSVNFERETLIAIFQGQQTTGGYGVQAQRVVEERGELYVDVAFTEPAEGAMTTQALTSPWTLVRVLRSGYGVAWVRDASDGTLVGVARRTE
ncbi:MAG TPA: protease complex subunit PrcB family protein [Trueperaceae bacterium]|nr:protease complex subunit PrcB family protein [Trueperaceae bacterium]